MKKTTKSKAKDIRIYQVYFEDAQKQAILYPAIPIDRRSFPISEQAANLYRENISFLHLWNNHRNFFSKYTGILSWKFAEKMGLSVREALNWIRTNPGYDVYLFNPFPHSTVEFPNIFDEAEGSHPGFKHVFRELLLHLKMPVSLIDNGIPAEYVAFCNYWIATQSFWRSYMSFLSNAIQTIESNPSLNTGMTKMTNHDSPTPMAPFVLERLFFCYLYCHKKGLRIFKYDSALWRLKKYEERLAWLRRDISSLQSIIYTQKKFLHRFGFIPLWNRILRFIR
jgi:hypothetical protein